MTGTCAFSIVSTGPRSRNSAPDVRVVDVGVGEDARLGIERLDEPGELVLGKNRDPIRIEFPREGRGILPGLDSRNLRRGKRDDAVRRIVAEVDVEIVEVAARGPEDDDLARLRHELESLRECKAFLDLDSKRGRVNLIQG